MDWSLALHRLADVPGLPEIVRTDVQAQPTATGPQVRIDLTWCMLLPEYDSCLVMVRLLDSGNDDVAVVKVDLSGGARSAVDVDAAGLALVPLNAGRYRFELVNGAGGLQSKAGEQAAGIAASLVVEASASEPSPPDFLPHPCRAGYPADSLPDGCEDDDVSATWSFVGGLFYHTFHDGVDQDWKEFGVNDNYASEVFFQPQTFGDPRWKYELWRWVPSTAYVLDSQGVLGGFFSQNIGVPARTGTLTGRTQYRFKVSPVDTAFTGTPSRYLLSRGFGYNPLAIGADSYEPDNGMPCRSQTAICSCAISTMRRTPTGSSSAWSAAIPRRSPCSRKRPKTPMTGNFG